MPVIEDGFVDGAESLSTRGRRSPSRPLLARDHCGSGGGGEVVGGPGGQARHAPLLLDGVRGAHDRDQGDDAQMPINLSAMTRVHEAKVIWPLPDLSFLARSSYFNGEVSLNSAYLEE